MTLTHKLIGFLAGTTAFTLGFAPAQAGVVAPTPLEAVPASVTNPPVCTTVGPTDPGVCGGTYTLQPDLGSEWVWGGGTTTFTDLHTDSGFTNAAYLSQKFTGDPSVANPTLTWLFTDDPVGATQKITFTSAELIALGYGMGDPFIFMISTTSPLPVTGPAKTPFAYNDICPSPNGPCYFSGNKSRNISNVEYHNVLFTGNAGAPYQALYYFEDQVRPGQSDNDFNDVGIGIEAVPGPLPLLGVGAAFGFSRKLRRRIVQAKA